MNSLIENMNEHCENRMKEDWIEWKEEDFDQLELKRNGCYTFTYPNPENQESLLIIPKICDRCFERYLTFKYEMREKETQSKEQEIADLKERLARLEALLNR